MLKKVLVVAVLIAVAVYAHQSGLHDRLTQESLRTTMAEAGSWGPILFVGLYVLGELVNIPSVIWVVVAGLSWPPVPAFFIAWVASIAAAVVVFSFYRYLARDTVQSRLPERLRHLDERLRGGGIFAVASVRLVAFLAPWTHPVLAVSSVSLRDYAIGTAIGVVPGVLLLVLFGGTVSSWIAGVPGWVWAAVASVVVVIVWRLRARRARAVVVQDG